MSITEKNHYNEWKSAFDKATLAGLTEVGMTAEGYAKKGCPVDTGNLRNSITNEVDAGSKTAYIGTNVEYAYFVEMGTSRMAAQPYLVPAASEHSDQYHAIIKKHLNG